MVATVLHPGGRQMGVFSTGKRPMPTDQEHRARRRSPWLPAGVMGNAAIVAVVVIVFLLSTLADAGIWDPHELRRAELARRIAIHLFGASELVADASADVMPTLSDLGSGELPFTSMALGLYLFGLVDWAGRLPLALWAVVGALVTFIFVARHARPRAGLYAVVALVTMPLYFMQARTMLGDVVTMAAFAMAFFGGLGALIEHRSTPVAIGWGLVAVVGLVAGFSCRGVLFGVATPALGVAATWGVVRLASATRVPSRGALVALGLFAVGTVGLVLGVLSLSAADRSSALVPRMLGFATVSSPPVSSTFDVTIRDLGHALFPWSALLPFAFGRLMWTRPRVEGEGQADVDAQQMLRAGLVVGAAVAFGAHAALAPEAGSLPFVATTILAAVLGLVVSDFEEGARHSGVVGFGTVVLGLVILWDLRRMPHKMLTVFHLPDAVVTELGDVAVAEGLMLPALAFLAVVWLTWQDPPHLLSVSPPEGPVGETAAAAMRRWLRGRIAHYERAAATVASWSGGNVAFALLVVEAGLVGLGIMLVVGRHLGWQSVTTMYRPLARLALNVWWAFPLGLAAMIVLSDLIRGLFAFALAWARLPRAFAIIVAALVCGGLICFGSYAAMAQRLSPKTVFVEYAARRGDGEPLALMGVDETSGRYYAAGASVSSVSGSREAVRWLTAGRRSEPPRRRWLVFDVRELGQLNAHFRQSEGINLPVIGDTTTESLLASSELGGEPNRNPLEPFVLPAPPPSIQHPVEADLGGRVRALGWELRDEQGDLVRVAVPGRRYRLTVYYRVVRRLRHDYRAFLHVDGEGRRHNADHEPVGGRYPTRLWRPGDVIADAHELVLEPNFTPGRYAVYFGLHVGKQRLEVRQGPHREHRIVGGELPVL